MITKELLEEGTIPEMADEVYDLMQKAAIFAEEGMYKRSRSKIQAAIQVLEASEEKLDAIIGDKK